jgi:hypothetical protein
MTIEGRMILDKEKSSQRFESLQFVQDDSWGENSDY